jgi:hypothetical protein
MEDLMQHPFPPLAPQLPVRSRYRLPFGQAPAAPIRVMTQMLPQISLPWLEIGLTAALLVMLHFA